MRSAVGIPCLQAGEDVKFGAVAARIAAYALRGSGLPKVCAARGWY
jgi:hypothetical protein